ALTSILSAFIFSALIVHSVGMPIEVAFIFSFPMFLIIGGFISFFADVYLNTIDFNHIFYKYISGLFIYFISGFFIISLFFAFFCGNMNILIVAIPSLLFYHISLLFKAIIKKEVTLIKDSSCNLQSHLEKENKTYPLPSKKGMGMYEKITV